MEFWMGALFGCLFTMTVSVFCAHSSNMDRLRELADLRAYYQNILDAEAK